MTDIWYLLQRQNVSVAQTENQKCIFFVYHGFAATKPLFLFYWLLCLPHDPGNPLTDCIQEQRRHSIPPWTSETHQGEYKEKKLFNEFTYKAKTSKITKL